MTAKEAIEYHKSVVDACERTLKCHSTIMDGSEIKETHHIMDASKLAIKALEAQAEVEEKTAWVKDALDKRQSDHEREFFDGHCPYTDDFCSVWTCNDCEESKREKEASEQMDKGEWEEYCGNDFEQMSKRKGLTDYFADDPSLLNKVGAEELGLTDAIWGDALAAGFREGLNGVADVRENRTSEMVMLDEAIKALEYSGYPACKETSYQIAQWLKELKMYRENRTSEWIPTSERLPEKQGYYLVTTDTKEVMRAWLLINKGKKYWVYSGMDVNATAWRLLPKPYREEENDRNDD